MAVVEPFGCSGSGVIAAAKLNRQWVYVESNHNNYSWGSQRVIKVVSELSIHADCETISTETVTLDFCLVSYCSSYFPVKLLLISCQFVIKFGGKNNDLSAWMRIIRSFVLSPENFSFYPSKVKEFLA